MTDQPNIEPLTFVAPVYNEHETIEELARRCRQQAEALGLEFRMIFVDDGSTDGSTQTLRSLAAEDPGITVLLLRSHFGKSAALGAAFAEIPSGWVVTIDSDLQDQPEELPKLVGAARAGADVVAGCRVVRNDSLVKRISSKLFNRAVSLVARQDFRDSNSGFKLFRYEVVRDLVLDGDRHRLVMLLAAWKGYHVVEVPVRHESRRCGRSKYGPLRFLSLLFDLCSVILVERFRHRPMHFFGSFGAACFAIGCAACAWLAAWRLLERGYYITNRPLFYVSLLLMILGVNFFNTGMLAELYNAQFGRSPGDYVRERLGRRTDPALQDAGQSPSGNSDAAPR